MTELHITPQMPEYPKIAHDVFMLLLDGKLRSRTETLKFLKPLAPPPPPPPPPPPKRGRAAKAAAAGAQPSASAAAKTVLAKPVNPQWETAGEKGKSRGSACARAAGKAGAAREGIRPTPCSCQPQAAEKIRQTRRQGKREEEGSLRGERPSELRRTSLQVNLTLQPPGTFR